MESIWTKTCQPTYYPPLDHDLWVDVAIIGGGLTGILTAYFMKKSGLSVAILERDRIGHGKSGHTTAKITSQHGLVYDKMISRLGSDRARQYAATQQKAVATYSQIIHQEQIACDFSRRSAYVYTRREKDPLQHELESALRLGLPASLVKDTELPFPVTAAVKFDHQAQFHPLKFLYGLASKLTGSDTTPGICACQNAACQIYEYSTVTKIKEHTLTVCSSQGIFSVHGHHIVMSTGFPIRDIPGFYFARQHQDMSYLLALDHVATDRPEPFHDMYYSADPGGYTFRSYDHLLLFGGLGHRSGQLHPGDGYQRLQNVIRQWYPQAVCTAQWSNEDAMPHDGLPFIGPFSLWMPHVYVATGYQKWGMTGAMVAATTLSQQITAAGRHDNGLSDPAYELYRPQRMSLVGAVPFFTDLGHTVLHLILQKPFAPRDMAKAKDKGFGPTCTHLGCTLSWNPADRTWDCPCHGSRYTEDGERIAGPACECMSGMRDSSTVIEKPKHFSS